MKSLRFLFAAAFLSGSPLFANEIEQPDAALACPARWGEPGRPLVAKEQTAKSIFTAVEREFFPAADKSEYPDVAARDGGGYWAVFRYRDFRQDKAKKGEIILRAGGGQLSLRIDKCTASISNVFYSR